MLLGVGMVVGCSTLVTDAEAATAASASGRHLFTWSVPSRFVPDQTGRLHDTQPEFVRRGPWLVTLRPTRVPCSADGIYRWFANGKPIRPTRTVGCEYQARFTLEGRYVVELKAVVGSRVYHDKQAVRVRDFLIVSIGDSVGSGESVPDVPGARRAQWNSARCHRSGRAGPAKVAARIEADDPHSSVTFVHLACSGATIPRGLRGPYAGAEPPLSEPPLPSQISQLAEVAARRPVDAVIVNIGANDVHFGAVVRFCATNGPDCFDRPFRGRLSTAQVVRRSLAGLDAQYGRVARDLKRIGISPGNVEIVQYFDPTTGSDGRSCPLILGGVTAAELNRARTALLEPLNVAVSGTRRFGWDVVTGVAERFRRHGYCADDPWVTTLTQSAASLGGRVAGRCWARSIPTRPGSRTSPI